jgi:hypothetical protein
MQILLDDPEVKSVLDVLGGLTQGEVAHGIIEGFKDQNKKAFSCSLVGTNEKRQKM